MKKYQIYCTTEGKWHHVASNSTLTKCPIDATHTVDNNSISIVDDNYTYKDGDFLELPLEELKTLRTSEINLYSDSLIEAGFTYDSKVFKCLLEDRMNYGHIKQFEASLPFPLEISAKDGGVYVLSQVDLDAFIGAALTHVNTILATGNYYKALIDVAIDEAAVNAVVYP